MCFLLSNCLNGYVWYSGFGKTSLLVRGTEDFFINSFVQTIENDFQVKCINMDGLRIKLQVCCRKGLETNFVSCDTVDLGQSKSKSDFAQSQCNIFEDVLWNRFSSRCSKQS